MVHRFIAFLMLTLMSSAFHCQAQTNNIQVQVNNTSQSGHEQDYTINGISKSKDIGGVDISAKRSSIEFGFVTTRGFMYKGNLPIITGITLTNYNSKPVTVILQLIYKTNLNPRPYPEYYDEGEKTLTVVLPSSKDNNHSKFIELPPAGYTFVTEIISADMIVRFLH